MTTCTSRTARAPRILGLLLLLAVAGCSFRASVTAADTTPAPGSHSSASTRPSSTAARTGTGPATGIGTGTRTRTTGPTTAVAASSSFPAAPSRTGIPPSATSSAASPTGVGRCSAAELTAGLVPGSSGAGQRYATLVLQNTGGRTCTVYGYGGIGLVSASGAPLPTRQVRIASPAPAPVTLAPRGAARSLLHWSAVAGTGDATSGPCQPPPAALQVIPPDETHHLTVSWNQGPVCEGGRIEQQAYTAG